MKTTPSHALVPTSSVILFPRRTQLLAKLPPNVRQLLDIEFCALAIASLCAIIGSVFAVFAFRTMQPEPHVASAWLAIPATFFWTITVAICIAALISPNTFGDFEPGYITISIVGCIMAVLSGLAVSGYVMHSGCPNATAAMTVTALWAGTVGVFVLIIGLSGTAKCLWLPIYIVWIVAITIIFGWFPHHTSTTSSVPAATTPNTTYDLTK